MKLLDKIRDFQFLSFIFNFALRNSKRWLKIECLRYCLKFGYQNSLMLCSCMKLLGKIRVVQFLNGFSSSWTAANGFFHVILDQKWNLSDTAESLATRIVWSCAHVWNFWARSIFNGFSSSWTAATCSSMLFLIENWMSQILLKVLE